MPLTPRAGVGYGCTEAPRGMLLSPLRSSPPTARIVTARIVPPTSQNQPSIEADLRRRRDADARPAGRRDLRDRCEQAIRNYDPCISCSTHFLRLSVHRA